MSNYPKQIIIRHPLLEFMGFCEIYCAASCCEKLAFEVHPALLRRKMIDFNLEGKNGLRRLNEAYTQFKSIRDLLISSNLQTKSDQVPFWSSEEAEWPDYWIELEGLNEWLVKWDSAFQSAIVLSENHGHQNAS